VRHVCRRAGKGATQINCLGSGNYGQLNTNTVSITGSLIIDCGAGNIGEVATTLTSPAIAINTSAAATIVLRHLSLNGGGKSANGISTTNFPGGTLIIENCMIRDFEIGILFAPSSGRGTLQVSDSLIYGNTFAIVADPASGQIASVTLNRDELTANNSGLVFEGGGVVAGTMRQTLVGESAQQGVIAVASQVFFTVEESSIINNLLTGIETNQPGAIVNVGASTIGGNGTGVLASRGSIISFGNNQMSANGANGSFTSTVPLQ